MAQITNTTPASDLTARAHIAAQLMAQMLPGFATPTKGSPQYADLAAEAVKAADALVAQLNEGGGA